MLELTRLFLYFLIAFVWKGKHTGLGKFVYFFVVHHLLSWTLTSSSQLRWFPLLCYMQMNLVSSIPMDPSDFFCFSRVVFSSLDYIDSSRTFLSLPPIFWQASVFPRGLADPSGQAILNLRWIIKQKPECHPSFSAHNNREKRILLRLSRNPEINK